MRHILLLGLLIFNYTVYAQSWGQTQKIIPSDRALADEFGWSVAIDGDYAVVGAHLDNNPNISEGSAYVFQNDGNGNWTEIQKLSAPDKSTNDFFGFSVDIDNETIIIGARNQDLGGPSSTNTNFLEASGAAYIFEKNNSGTWDFVFKAVAPDRDEFDLFSEAVAVSGDYAVVTAQAEGEDENEQNTIVGAGSAYIYEKDGAGNWNFAQKIVTSDRAIDDRLGRDRSLDIDGNTIVIAAEAEDEDENGLNTLNYAGSVYVFERNGAGVWSETQKIVPSNRAIEDAFGSDVDIDGNYIVVGAQLADRNATNSGSAYVFKKVAGVWQETQELVSSNEGVDYRFGRAVDINGDHIIIGAYNEQLENNGTIKSFAGAVYIYEKNTNDVWNLVQRNYTLDANVQDNFGWEVAISGDYALVGAYRQDEDDNGQNPLTQAGAAYIFDANEPNTLSILEHSFSSVIKAYPNPTKNVLNLDFGVYHEAVTITVNNILGQLVFSENYTSINSVQLELNQPKGMYLAEVKIDGQVTSIIKIVKH